MPDSLEDYVRNIVGVSFVSGEVFAKILTPNDDSGRHGVLVPNDVYSFFPDFNIPDPAQNATIRFEGFDILDRRNRELSYKYYQRYPERRITCLNGLMNDRESGTRLIVFLHIKFDDGSSNYFIDEALESEGARFKSLVSITLGDGVELTPGVFVRREVTANVFQIDDPLADLLARFDTVRDLGWVNSLRAGDTGIGYTFETLIDIEENNSKQADFRGIELKCKQTREDRAVTGKINLFQQAPEWSQKMTGLERLKFIGQAGNDGRYACYSQVTTHANNLDLRLHPHANEPRIDLMKGLDEVGFWQHETLQKRLLEKHSRAAFIKAKVREVKAGVQFRYEELLYCEQPSITRFIDLVSTRNIVFEFTMSEKNGAVRNHGYPWRLTKEDLLEDLFGFQIQLRTG